MAHTSCSGSNVAVIALPDVDDSDENVCECDLLLDEFKPLVLAVGSSVFRRVDAEVDALELDIKLDVV